MPPKSYRSFTGLKLPLDDQSYTYLTQEEEKSDSRNLSVLQTENESSRSDYPWLSSTSLKCESICSSVLEVLNSRAPWMLSTALFFCTTVVLLASRTVPGGHGTFEAGFSTDFGKCYRSQISTDIELTFYN